MCFFGHAGDPRWGESEVTSLQLGLKSGAGASVRGIQRELNEHLKDTSFGTDGTAGTAGTDVCLVRVTTRERGVGSFRTLKGDRNHRSLLFFALLCGLLLGLKSEDKKMRGSMGIPKE